MSGAGLTVSGLSTGQIIAPGQSAILSVVFLPLLTGSMSGSVVVTSDASNSPTTISLSGTGVLLVTHSAALSWIASSSSVAGYNVYSGTVSGGPYNKITTSPVATVSYKDSSVQSGKTYYYVITAVNSSSVESTYSNQVSAVVP
jgi:fibronectin type 3 domain-containing protein